MEVYSAQIAERFWSKVDRSGDVDACWLWSAGTLSGYGMFWIDGQNRRAPRVSWELQNGPIPDGLLVLHSCDVRYAIDDITYRRCVNPAHLWLGTPRDNMDDMWAKGRGASGDRSGARLHPERVARGDRSPSRLHPESRPRGDAHYSRLRPELLARGDDSGARRHPETRPKGATHYKAALTAEQVIEAVERYNNGERLRSIAALFGVSHYTIQRAIQGTTYTNASRPPITVDRFYATPGEASPRALLTNAQATEMRAMFSQGMRQVEIARVFGVSRHFVWKVIHQVSYRGV